MFHPDQEPMSFFQYHPCVEVLLTTRLLHLHPCLKQISLGVASGELGFVSMASVGLHDLVVLGKQVS